MPLPSAFLNSKVGQLIKIDDVDLLIELSDSAAKTLPTFLIKERNSYVDGETTIILLLLDHVGSDVEYLLMAHMWSDQVDVKLFHMLDFFTPEQRAILQDGEFGWLFDGADYPAEIYNDGVDPYVRKVQSEVYGSTAIVEYETTSKIVNYRLLIIEEGIHNNGGGLVRFYEGRLIHPEHVSL